MPGPYAKEGVATEEAKEFARRLISQANRLRLFAAEQFLHLYNDTWRDEDKDEPELTQQEFLNRLGQPSIVLYDEPGAAMVYFSPGEMFGGHSIQISFDDGEPCRAILVG